MGVVVGARRERGWVVVVVVMVVVEVVVSECGVSKGVREEEEERKKEEDEEEEEQKEDDDNDDEKTGQRAQSPARVEPVRPLVLERAAPPLGTSSALVRSGWCVRVVRSAY